MVWSIVLFSLQVPFELDPSHGVKHPQHLSRPLSQTPALGCVPVPIFLLNFVELILNPRVEYQNRRCVDMPINHE
jgi:hypothetical protein